MKPRTFINVVLPLIGLTLSPGCYSVKITRVTNGNDRGPSGLIVFSEYDWELEPNQVVPIYTRTHDQKNVFAFVAIVPSETSGEVVMATIFSSDDDQKTCWEDFSNPYGGTPIFRRMDYVDRTTVEVQYTTEVLRFEGSGWGQNVDTSECATPDVKIQRSQPAAQPSNTTNWNSTHHSVKASYLAGDILGAEKVNSTEGFIFTSDNNETNPSTSIMFANKATGETKTLDVIQQAPNKQQRQSYAHGKVGYCLMDDVDIICRQNAWNGKVIMNFTHIYLPNKADWLAVHNLKSEAMLVVTTDCPRGTCDKFKVQKIEEGDQVRKEEEVRGFRMNCKDPAVNLQMHTTDVPDYSRICLNFVCTDSDYRNRRVFQYRRHCFTKDYFESK